MSTILIEGERLRLRRAELSDFNYIFKLQYAPENLKFIVPYNEEFQLEAIHSDGSKKMNIIVEEIATAEPVGYFFIQIDEFEIEWRHIIIDKKGVGYGREGLKLLMKWSFEIKKFHRAWLDCKDYNTVALNLYESSGMVREGLIRETLLTNGVYENLVIFGILDREYFQLMHNA